MRTKTTTVLVAGAALTAGFMMGFGGYVFAGDPVPGLDINIEQIPGGSVSAKNYKSSLSNTKTIGQVRMEVGDVLLRYGFGGADINKVTDALEGGGVYEAELKSFLLAVGMNEQDTQNILLEFDKIGISQDGAQAVSPDAPTIEFTTGEEGVSTPNAGGAVPSAAEGTIKNILPSGPSKEISTSGAGDAARALVNQELHRPPTSLIENLKAAESKEEREDIKKELKYRRVLLQQGVQTLRQNLRENSQALRDNFRENVETTIGHVDHGKTGRIALAHGKGLRMVNRYRSAIARFDHILGRMESRVQKLGIEIEAEARAKGKVKWTNPPENLVILIEEAKNTQVEAEAKLAELEAKYESLLTGENPGGVAEEAREIARELKLEIEKLHDLLGDIQQAAVDYNSSRSNVKL